LAKHLENSLFITPKPTKVANNTTTYKGTHPVYTISWHLKLTRSDLINKELKSEQAST